MKTILCEMEFKTGEHLTVLVSDAEIFKKHFGNSNDIISNLIEKNDIKKIEYNLIPTEYAKQQKEEEFKMKVKDFIRKFEEVYK